jgi:hypothetical protein
VVHDDAIESAVLTAVDPSALSAGTPLPARTLLAAGGAGGPGGPAAGLAHQVDRSYLHRNSACARCPRPCEFAAPAQASGLADAADAELPAVFTALLAGDVPLARAGFHAWRDRWPGTEDGTGDPDDVADLGEFAGPGDPVAGGQADGVAYCAASQAGYRWLGQVISARASAATATPPASPLPPGALVTREQGAREIARAVAGLMPPGDALAGPSAVAGRGGAPGDLVAQAGTGLRALLAAVPPKELPGCGTCPARCLTLPAAAGFLAGPGRGTPHRVSAATSAATRLRSVAELVDPAFPGLAAGQRDALMHCVITNAAHAAGTDPAELLAGLHDGTRP